MARIRGILIIILGALPATALLWLAHIPFAAAFLGIGEHIATSLLVIGWFCLAVAGTLALWVAPFRQASPILVAGLIAGLFAIIPFFYFLTRDWVDSQGDRHMVMSVLMAGPTIVAAFLLAAFFLRRKE